MMPMKEHTGAGDSYAGLSGVLERCEETANAGFSEYAGFRSGSCMPAFAVDCREVFGFFRALKVRMKAFKKVTVIHFFQESCFINLSRHRHVLLDTAKPWLYRSLIDSHLIGTSTSGP